VDRGVYRVFTVYIGLGSDEGLSPQLECKKKKEGWDRERSA